MKHAVSIFCAAALALSLGACSNNKVSTKPTPHTADLELVSAGEADARRALLHDSASAERVEAVLEIHARAHELAEQGMPNCAEDYLTGARNVLKDL